MSYYSQLEPFVQALFDELSVGFWQVELFAKYGLVVLEMDPVGEILGQS